MNRTIAVVVLGWLLIGKMLEAQQPVYLSRDTVRTNLNVGTSVVTLSNASGQAYYSICVQATGTVSALCWGGSSTNNYGGYYVPAGGAAVCIGLPIADVRPWQFIGLGGTANLFITREPQ